MDKTSKELIDMIRYYSIHGYGAFTETVRILTELSMKALINNIERELLGTK